MISCEMMPNVHVFRTKMLNGIFSKVDSTSIVTQDRDLGIPQVDALSTKSEHNNLLQIHIQLQQLKE